MRACENEPRDIGFFRLQMSLLPVVLSLLGETIVTPLSSHRIERLASLGKTVYKKRRARLSRNSDLLTIPNGGGVIARVGGVEHRIEDYRIRPEVDRPDGHAFLRVGPEELRLDKDHPEGDIGNIHVEYRPG
ncbi:hypothetical protein A3G67_04410 [Candidatus Roizmanbacteria bacterium RIFCSPLOWO2_12_FULL_40_12]|uniref:Uncharacterized protein n=1 Tax=Candidatus Roizmanbacteria bacterium RIFCSPLOWO2_01_FULL_40_42 TaxID=1802066 RepID=A0A1F7J4T9_9BACT|nr:MAG: hypothetical protein A2779_04740 [Candidatus Roizmanbacteria bacterium RIFCSPHIGHO2_01_FULL_40_98]OGK27380.1 MAG: hypothetical protein A3C31_05065 [Candidatus Roizmanbacteria bacterium RIFCSPHIGHO2_02_FULL_40_53]OGK30748.1 MAG: hypothetical protein A2W49_01975 [Candidatus Roizmanbacteria bacterium RIFCSPHIGHO2_12_41_18]OGK36485.1 MAG: hypothetical protein A3E69_02690 [Candidatus Roizmanbacteria bacterium RIFCSPHIGHO2_12_FULL_40_130]OGK50613.1 MAG: hypothetical protein A3B50_02420 [Candi